MYTRAFHIVAGRWFAPPGGSSTSRPLAPPYINRETDLPRLLVRNYEKRFQRAVDGPSRAAGVTEAWKCMHSVANFMHFRLESAPTRPRLVSPARLSELVRISQGRRHPSERAGRRLCGMRASSGGAGGADSKRKCIKLTMKCIRIRASDTPAARDDSSAALWNRFS